MATNKYIQGLTRQGFRLPKTGGGYAWAKLGTNSQVDVDDHKTQLVLAGNRNTAGFIRVAASNSTTATIIGLSRRGFRIKNSGGSIVTVKVGSGVHTVTLADNVVRRTLLRSKRDWAFAASATALTVRGIQNEQNGFYVKGLTTSKITSNNTNVSNADTVIIGAKTYTFKTNLTEAKATDTVSASGTPADGNTVVVNGTTYTFKTALTPATGEVLINGQDGSLVNLAHAINQSGGSPGTDYVAGAANAYVTANATVSGHAITLTAKTVGTGGNAYTLTKVGANLGVGGATFSGGVNSIANEVLISGTNADGSLTNLSEAINGGANAGTDYSSATTANADATASTVASHAITLTATEGGSSTVAISTTAVTLTVSNATLEDTVQKIYRGVSLTIDATNPFNFQQLRRHYDRWIEG